MLFAFWFFCGGIKFIIRGIGCLIGQRQLQWNVGSGKTPTIPFNIFIDARYHWVKVVGDEATLQSSIVGLCKTIKKSVECWHKECVCLPFHPTSTCDLNIFACNSFSKRGVLNFVSWIIVSLVCCLYLLALLWGFVWAFPKIGK